MFILNILFFISWKILIKIKYILYNKINIQNKFLSPNLKLLGNLKKNGYVVIKNFLSDQECKKIIREIEFFIKKKKTYWTDTEKSDQRIFGSENISKLIFDYHNDKTLKALGSNYIGVQIKNAFTMANKVKYNKNNKGSGGGWHKDSFTSQYKTILYLNDAKFDNGAFELILDSHKLMSCLKISKKFNLNIFKTRFSNEEINLLTFKDNKIKTLYGKAGTLIIVDTSMIHRGRPLKKGFRYAITNYYYPYYNFKKYKNKFKPMIKYNYLNK